MPLSPPLLDHWGRAFAEACDSREVIATARAKLVQYGGDSVGQAHNVQLLFIRPGKPVENAFIESFNGKFRDGCLNQHWFLSLADARRIIEAWRVEYNTAQVHRALNRLAPAQFAAQFRNPREVKSNRNTNH